MVERSQAISNRSAQTIKSRSRCVVALSKKIVDLFLAWAKERRLNRPEEEQRKLTIYGPDRKPVKIITVKADHVEEEWDHARSEPP